jgi:hypothetical protein
MQEKELKSEKKKKGEVNFSILVVFASVAMCFQGEKIKNPDFCSVVLWSQHGIKKRPPKKVRVYPAPNNN